MLSSLLLVAVVALLAAPGAAGAATISKSGTVFVYTADAGNNSIGAYLHPSNTNIVFADAGAAVDPSAAADCSDYFFDPFGPQPNAKYGIQCSVDPGDSARLVLGDGDDFSRSSRSSLCVIISSSPCYRTLTIPLEVFGGAGNDNLISGSGAARLNGEDGDDTLSGGAAADRLDGGAGRDLMVGNAAADEFIGGSGIDEVSYANVSVRVVVDLDDQPDDGAAGEGDTVHADVEDVTGGSGPDVLTGNGAANVLQGGGDGDIIKGEGGFDQIYGEEGEDTLDARDGNTERVDCGDGSDVATTDTSDKTSGCETIDASPDLEGDLDGDGFRTPADCDDTNSAIKPGATDVAENGVDENCDGADTLNRDKDGDGVDVPTDCDDTNPAIKPGAREVYGNGTDEDCSGRADPLQTLSSFVRAAFVTGTTTRVTRFRARSVRGGTTIRVTCAGRGCRVRSVDIPVARDSTEVDLRRATKLTSARAAVKVTVYFLREDSITRLQTFTFRRKKLPRIETQCLRPGETRAGTCPGS